MNAHAPLIAPAELKALSTLKPYRTLLALAGDWAVIAACIAAAEWSGSLVVYLIAITIIAGRMHGLGVLMHEAAHYRFMKDRKRADSIADIFMAWPILTTVDGYRRNHLAHHQNTNTPDDPDWVVKVGTAAFTFPQKLWRGLVHMGGYLLTINTFRDLAQILPRISKGDRSTQGYKVARIGFYIAVLAVCGITGTALELVIYWVVPYFTLFFLFLYVRAVAEHFGEMDYDQELRSTRTMQPYFWERWFFAPHNINYHLEHHLYPGVPFYNLPALHRAMMEGAYYRDTAKVTRGYTTGLVRECFA